MKCAIASAQYPVAWHRSFDDWADYTDQWARRGAAEGAHILLFPEYGSMELVSLLSAEERADIRLQVYGLDRLQSAFCATFSEIARRYGVVIAAPSFPVRAGALVYNRCFVFGPSGGVGYQDKYFMTRFETEEWGVSAAPPRLCVFDSDWGVFGVQICYDVEFPSGAAGLCRAGADIILAPSCTETLRGATRVHVGARARALEQQCYTVVSPLVGDADWSPTVDINFGYAAFYSAPDKFFPEEGVIGVMEAQAPGWLTRTLDLDLIAAVRRDGQTLNHRDGRAWSASAGQAYATERTRL